MPTCCRCGYWAGSWCLRFWRDVLYGSLFLAVGAACNELKEAQSLLTPMIILLVMPMMVWFNVVQEPLGAFVAVDFADSTGDTDVNADAAGSFADGANMATGVGDDIGARDGGVGGLRRRPRVSDWTVDAGESAEDDGVSAVGGARVKRG